MCANELLLRPLRGWEEGLADPQIDTDRQTYMHIVIQTVNRLVEIKKKKK